MDISDFNSSHKTAWPKDTLKDIFKHYPEAAISFSGAEDVVLIDMASKVTDQFNVFCLDTGRLHHETLEFIEKVKSHYGIGIQFFYPDADQLQKLTSEKGLFSFYEDTHKECCGIRKIEPLKRALANYPAWITGQRTDQSPNTRANIELAELDSNFKGVNGELIKFNPLARWTSQDVWDYIKMFDVPFNPLHLKGYKSIGCQPCTRPTLPNQHEREGRWWWEDASQKECGLHQSNIIQSVS